jgi:hypothetical protein
MERMWMEEYLEAIEIQSLGVPKKTGNVEGEDLTLILSCPG